MPARKTETTRKKEDCVIVNPEKKEYACNNRLKAIRIADGVKEIGWQAFWGCKKLSMVAIPDSVESIDDEAFAECKNLTTILFPKKLKSIGREAFAECSNLRSVVIPKSVKEIGEQAFFGCTSLTSVVIPDNVSEVGFNAFWKCPGLTNPIIPSQIKGDKDAVYQKVSQTLKIRGGGDLYRVKVNSLKGTIDCIEKLNQLAAVLHGCKLEYWVDRNGLIDIEVSGDCDTASDLWGICSNYDEELTEEEIKVFLCSVPFKDDFWNWLYQVEMEKDNCGWYEIFSSLIAPDYHREVMYISEFMGELNACNINKRKRKTKKVEDELGRDSIL